jgi:hypothetical protein
VTCFNQIAFSFSEKTSHGDPRYDEHKAYFVQQTDFLYSPSNNTASGKGNSIGRKTALGQKELMYYGNENRSLLLLMTF